MRLSISARIFAGYIIVLTVFGAVIAYSFHSSKKLRQDLHLINDCYLSTALLLAEVRTIQGNLLNALTEKSAGRPASSFLKSQLAEFRRWRLREIHHARDILRRGSTMDPRAEDDELIAAVAERLEVIASAYRANEPLFEAIFAAGSAARQASAGSVAGAGTGAAAKRSEETLLRQESKINTVLLRLRDTLQTQVRVAAARVDQAEQRSFWAVMLLVVVAVAVTLAVTFRARHTLRPLKTLVAGTQRIGTGDYSHRVKLTSTDELGVLSEEFNKMASAIEEREQRLLHSTRLATAGRIAAHITHEIRNPLSSVSLNTELLDEELSELAFEGAKDCRKLCAAIQREVDRLTDITEQYLQFARLPRAQLQPENINDIVSDLLDFAQAELQARKITLKRWLATDLPLVAADENQLRQALINLVRNASEAIGSDGGEITVTSYRDGDRVFIEIQDSGGGIAEEHLLNIFAPFFTTKQSGTGLGLAWTKQLLDEHGGTIAVQSQVGRGTTVKVGLPLSREPQKPKPALEHEGHAG